MFREAVAAMILGVLGAGGAAAQEAGGWYVSGAVTRSSLDDSDGAVANAIGPGGVIIPSLLTTNSVEDGWGGHLAVGRSFGRFRAEAEWGYTENDADSYSVTSPFTATLPQDGENNITRYMLNGYAEMGEGRVRPYLGAGAGAAHVEVVTVATVAAAPTAPPRRLIDDSDTVFAYQIMAGVGVPLSERLSLTAQYRWFDADTVEGRDARGERFTRGIEGHNIDLGLRLRF